MKVLLAVVFFVGLAALIWRFFRPEDTCPTCGSYDPLKGYGGHCDNHWHVENLKKLKTLK